MISGATRLLKRNRCNSFRYSGELWDHTTELQYLRARWYDPSEGRFISEDTYEGKMTSLLSQNLYTYVHNNPVFCFLRGDFENMGISSKSAGKATFKGKVAFHITPHYANYFCYSKTLNLCSARGFLHPQLLDFLSKVIENFPACDL